MRLNPSYVSDEYQTGLILIFKNEVSRFRITDLLNGALLWGGLLPVVIGMQNRNSNTIEDNIEM